MTQLSAAALKRMIRTSLDTADDEGKPGRHVHSAGRDQGWMEATWVYRPYCFRLIYTLKSRTRKDAKGNPLPEVGAFEWAWADKPDEKTSYQHDCRIQRASRPG